MKNDSLLVTASNGELTITSECFINEGDKVNIADYEEGSTLIPAKFAIY